MVPVTCPDPDAIRAFVAGLSGAASRAFRMSTYMLTVATLVKSGRLVPYRVPRANLRSRRLVLLSTDAAARVGGPWGGEDDEAEVLRRELLVTLDRVVEGQPLPLLFTVLSARDAIVQLKLMKPKPGVRIIGGFLDTDVFAGLFIFRRDELPDKRRSLQTASALAGYETINADTRRAFTALGLWPLHRPQSLFQARKG